MKIKYITRSATTALLFPTYVPKKAPLDMDLCGIVLQRVLCGFRLTCGTILLHTTGRKNALRNGLPHAGSLCVLLSIYIELI